MSNSQYLFERKVEDFKIKGFFKNQIEIIVSCEINHNLVKHVVDIEKEYNKKLKKEWSIFGNLKMGNVLHNRYMEQNKKHDYRLKELSKYTVSINELYEKLSYNDLTITDVNTILKIENRQFHEKIKIIISEVVLIVVLFIFLKF